MTTEEEKAAARCLLNMARDGGRVSRETITECLIVLGDLPQPEDDDPIVQRILSVGEWERRYAGHANPATWLCGLAC